ncbi:Por secretion system C-terminal sorting domain-containing protein [Ekhidna lutea]|uniref:Por secretion system C-terminal sorting domain-containing protein n=1 Tax=Ekhidna lutea TaxID=447679 RepID=A0A239IGT9_EKHLU|nr:T9SS type A sorting domain-containing protein [Ekhidna lutea]SNS91634.1 Por secretion system C-terminal sorting domain-containing protein [Ekhidna lutea]
MKAKLTIGIVTLAMALGGHAQGFADDDGKIIVEITKEINGEKKTFKGEYNSTEEMHADPNYQEFAGKDEQFNFWFDRSGDDDVFLHLDQLRDHNKSFFKFFHGDEEDGDNTFFFKHFDDDSVDGFFDLHLDGMNLDEYRERMKQLGIEMEEMFDKFHGDKSVRVIEIKRVKIEDVDDEFGKKGKVDDSSMLELDDLSFYPNPSSNGRFKVRFSVPEEGSLAIKVSNLEGKEVFSRHFDRFGGTYSEMIDLSGQKEGIYLLEISQGKKRLTKKIVIN